MANESVYFYGRFASGSKRELERLARERGYRVASSLRDTVAVVVLGEDEPLAAARERLAADFDDRSRASFEAGTLAIVAESTFRARALESCSRADSDAYGSTPAAVAELVGVTVASVRRWMQRGFLRPFYRGDRLPFLSSRELMAARRLSFLTSTGLSDDFLARRFVSFANLALARSVATRASSQTSPPRQYLFDYDDPSPSVFFSVASVPYDASLASDLGSAPFDVGAIIMKTTLASDGKDVLFFNDGEEQAPVDFRGQRRFEFAVAPADGAYEAPERAPLSEEEAQIALADRLREWNSATTNATGQPAFLALFTGEEAEPSPCGVDPPATLAELIGLSNASPAARALAADAPDSTTHSVLLSKDARERIRAAAGRRLVDLCEDAWNLEREGYWEEAARVYRAAALAGGADASVCYRLGKVLFLLGDYSAARERFFTALELDEDFVDARVELGKTFVALGDLEDALSCFQGALVDRPRDASLYYELGKLYFQLGRREEAQTALRNALARAEEPKLIEEIKKTSLEITLGGF